MKIAAAPNLGILISFLFMGCIPWAQNLTGTPELPEPAVRYFRATDQVLVLPLWFDNGPCNVRGPIVLSGNSLPELDDHLKDRWRLGVMGLDGHGPSHYRSISGFLLVGANRRLVWVPHLSGSSIATGVLTNQLGTALSTALASNGDIDASGFPQSDQEPFLGRACRLAKIGAHLDASERELATGFLQQAMAAGGS